jgi:hypothetical protein
MQASHYESKQAYSSSLLRRVLHRLAAFGGGHQLQAASIFLPGKLAL